MTRPGWAWWVDVLFLRNWWRYRPNVTPAVELPYHVFNLFEGCAWVVFALLVIRRMLRRGVTRLEVAYALAFVTFGLTDFREAYALDSWLIWIKLINLIVLFRLRSRVIRRLYPGSRLY